MIINKKITKGFTLIELLVVISIIALLVSILMPALSKARQQAQRVVCMSNMQQWGLIVRMYADDNNGKFVPTVGGQQRTYWMSILKQYYVNDEIRVCPSARGFQYLKDGSGDPAAITSLSNWGPFYSATGTFWAEDGDYGSYGVNSYAYDINSPNHWRNLNERNASEIPLILDSWWVEGAPRADEVPPPTWPFRWNDSGVLGNNMARFCINRHNGVVSVVFMDSSVSTVGLKRLWELRWGVNYDRHGKWTRSGGVQTSDWPDWMRSLPD